VDHFRVALDFLDEDSRAWVMGKAAARILRWPESAFDDA
jgi:L-fuconolactonase